MSIRNSGLGGMRHVGAPVRESAALGPLRRTLRGGTRLPGDPRIIHSRHSNLVLAQHRNDKSNDGFESLLPFGLVPDGFVQDQSFIGGQSYIDAYLRQFRSAVPRPVDTGHLIPPDLIVE